MFSNFPALTALTSDNFPFVWAQDCQQAFDALKLVFVSTLILSMTDLKNSYVLKTDASYFTLGETC